jgi:hypothetical protein
MNLSDGRCGQGSAVHAGEHRRQWGVKALLDDPFDRLPRLGGNLVAAFLELVDQRLGKDALAGGQDLAQLDEGGAEVLGSDPQAPGQTRHRGLSAFSPVE